VGLRRVSSPVSSSQADSRPVTAAQLSLRVLSRLCHGPFPENDCQPGSDSGQRWASLFPDRATNSGLGKLLRLLITALVPAFSTPCLPTYLARDIWDHCEYRVTRTQLSLSLTHTHTERRAQQPPPGHGTVSNQSQATATKRTIWTQSYSRRHGVGYDTYQVLDCPTDPCQNPDTALETALLSTEQAVLCAVRSSLQDRDKQDHVNPLVQMAGRLAGRLRPQPNPQKAKSS
jgi:hypothetical protein